MATETREISPQSRRHNEMRLQAIRAHPELRALKRTQPLTVLALPVLLALHWSIAWAVSEASVPTIFLVAFLVGQLVYHAAGSLIHETCHKLIFRGKAAKLGFDLGLEFILSSYGKSLDYQHAHISSHHPYIGDYEHDYEHEDICGLQARLRLKARRPMVQHALTLFHLFIHALPLGSVFGDMILNPVIRHFSDGPTQDPRRDIGGTRPPVWQQRLFIATSAFSNLVMLLLLGPWALLYHLWSLSLFLGKCGISNLGQSLSEHAGTDDLRPTRSTYGWINLLLFNTGYHSEHHSFPNVPWTELPKIRKAAPEVFDNEAEHSYFGYWWRHVIHDFTPSRDNPMIHQDNTARCEGRA